MNDIAAAGLVMRDLRTEESSHEEIFVSLVKEDAA
jgi:ABC-2 type transport system ATP-binding protein